jgi:iron complex transport system ATP-binding protein
VAVSDPLIRVQRAGFRYGERQILDGLDLDVRRGEILSVLGANGCGKTTLLRCIAGALRPSSGSVEIGGDDVHRLPPSARGRRIGFLFQDHAPTFPYAVHDVVLMGRAPHLGFLGFPGEHDRVLAEAALERVGLSHLKERPYTRLSGGERQLVLLARTLVQEPEVILLDEPTTHLDVRNQVRTLGIVRALAEDGMTMIMTTHDPNHAFWVGGRAALMKEGGFIAVGPTASVMTEETLRETYDVDVAVFSIPSRTASHSKLWTAWLHDPD